MRDTPLLVVTLTVWAYWLRVGAMVVRARRRQHRDVGVVPERPVERAMWLVWVPLVGFWCVLPWLGITHERGPFALPDFARTGTVYPTLRWLAAAGAVACLVATIGCWISMRRGLSASNTSRPVSSQ